MDPVNVSAVDLNLLVVLEALLQDPHVTRAARKVGLSQPGMSNALSRLRELFDDPLLVRRAGGMALTRRAEQLRAPVQETLTLIRRRILAPEVFEPAHSDRRFAIVADEYVAQVLLARALARWRQSARGVSVRLFGHRQHLPVEALHDGTHDLALGVFWQREPSLVREVLWEEHFVCVCERGLLAPRQRLTLERYLALPHVLVSPSGADRGIVDELLAAKGRVRRLAAVLPGLYGLPAVLRATGAVATLPSRVARALGEDFITHRLPLEAPRWPVCMLWDPRLDPDPGHAWLREQLRSAAGTPGGVSDNS